VARHLGRSRYVPLGYSRKYWYRDELSEPVSSITTPGKGKLLYIDPNQLGLIAGKRVLVVDDAVSSGTTMVSGLKLLERCGARGRHCRGHAPGHAMAAKTGARRWQRHPLWLRPTTARAWSAVPTVGGLKVCKKRAVGAYQA
jgi:hypothetical protein